jgi:FtsH-binding integral membrane protein
MQNDPATDNSSHGGMYNMETNYASNAAAAAAAKARQEASTVFLAKVFNWMAAGLGLTGLVAWLTATNGLFPVIQPLFLPLIIAEVGVVWYLSARIDKLQPSTATGLFFGYAFLNGLTLSVIFLAYSGTSIAATFLITAGMFLSMSIYGMVTKRNLDGLGSFMFMGLIGIIIASIVNLFIGSETLGWAISLIGVVVFVGLTAYDVQKIKMMGEQGIMSQGDAAVRKGAIIGALALYLDFINLFLMLLRFFGGGRD